MLDLEETAMSVVDNLLANEKLPLINLKKLNLNWVAVEGNYLPVLECEFYDITEKETMKHAGLPL